VGTDLVGFAEVEGAVGVVDPELDGAVGDSDGPGVDAAIELAGLDELPVGGGGAGVHPASTATAIVIVIVIAANPRRSVVNRPTIS
jgi:hypothetical protein